MATRTIASVGGNWSVTSTWVEGAVPTAADEVVATGASGFLNIDIDAVCRSIDLTGYKNTLLLPPSQSLTIGDATLPTGSVALKFPTGMSVSCVPTGAISVSSRTKTVGDITFISTAVGVQTVDFNSNNVGIVGNVIFNAASAGSWQLVSSLNASWWSAVTLTKGTLDFNGQTCDFGRFSSDNSNVRTLTLGAAQIFLHSIENSGTDTWATRTVTNLTVTANTAVVSLSQEQSAGNNLWASGTINYNGMSVIMCCSGGGLHTTVGGTPTFFNFTVRVDAIPPYKPWYTTDRWQVNNAVTVTNKLTMRGFDSGRRLRVTTNSGTSLRTMGVTGATVDCEYCDLLAIGFNVAQNFSANTVGDEGANSSVTFPVGATQYFYAPGKGNKRWSYPGYWWLGTGGSGGVGRVPLPQDTARIDDKSIDSPGVNVISDMPRCGGVDWTGVTNSPNWHHQRLFVAYGNITLGTGMTMSATRNASFTLQILQGAAATYTVQSNGVTWRVPLTFSTIAAHTVKFLDDFVSEKSVLTSVGFTDLNNKNITCTTFNNSSGALTMGSGTITLTGVGTVWSSGGTIASAGTSLIKLTDTQLPDFLNSPMFTKTFAGNGRTYNNIEFAGTGRGRYTITGSNTFNDFKSSKTVPFIIQFTNGTTQTVTTFTVAGSAGKYVSLFSTSSSAGYTLTKAGGGTIVGDYWIVSRGTFSPGATWSATNSVDCDNNSGITGLGDGPITWTGATDSNFSIGTNWTGGVAPGASDIAFFIGTRNVACTMDAAVNVAGVQIGSAYTATITQAAAIIVGDLEWSQLNGTFTGATQAITFNGCFYKNGGTFTPSTGTLTFGGTMETCIRTDTNFNAANSVVVSNTAMVLMLTAGTFSGAGQTFTINVGSRLHLNGQTLTVTGALTVNGTLRTTGADLAVGSKVISITTSTIELASSNTIALETAFGTSSFYHLILSTSKILNMTSGNLYTINGNIYGGTADMVSGQGTPQRGQCTLQPTLEGYPWKLNLVGKSFIGAAAEFRCCDARSGRFVDASGSIYLDSFACKPTGNFRVFTNPRQADAIFRNQRSNL